MKSIHTRVRRFFQTITINKRRVSVGAYAEKHHQGFDKQTQAYELARPRYPKEAVDSLLQKTGNPTRILELGSGTGLFTRVALRPGQEYTCVEPSEAMRMKFQEKVPDVQVLSGTASDLTFLPESSFDAVYIAQAFHWFAKHETLEQIHRVLSPGGYLGLIWILEDGTVSWVNELRNLYEEYDAGLPQYRRGLWRSLFVNAEELPEDIERRKLFPPVESGERTKLFGPVTGAHHPFEMAGQNKDLVWNRIKSKSYIADLSEDRQTKLSGEVFQLLNTHWGEMEYQDYPHVCDYFWTQKI